MKKVLHVLLAVLEYGITAVAATMLALKASSLTCQWIGRPNVDPLGEGTGSLMMLMVGGFSWIPLAAICPLIASSIFKKSFKRIKRFAFNLFIPAVISVVITAVASLLIKM